MKLYSPLKDLRHFFENNFCRKRSHTPILTLIQMKCGLKRIFRGLSFYGINLRIMQTELNMVIVIVDKVSFNEESHNVLTVHIETPPSKREQ